MKLEIVATNLKDVKEAQKFGADRIELITAITELGLTPSYGLMKETLEVAKIPVNVIIRPHNRSFYMDEDDVKTMITDIEMVKKLGANGIVIGSLAETGDFDFNVLEKLLAVSGTLDVTIHRAFDFAKDQVTTLKQLMHYPHITTVLTAGGNYNAPEAVSEINKLVDLAEESHIKLMIGNGLRADNLALLLEQVQPSINALHFGSGVRIDEESMNPLDKQRITKIKSMINNA